MKKIVDGLFYDTETAIHLLRHEWFCTILFNEQVHDYYLTHNGNYFVVRNYKELCPAAEEMVKRELMELMPPEEYMKHFYVEIA